MEGLGGGGGSAAGSRVGSGESETDVLCVCARCLVDEMERGRLDACFGMMDTASLLGCGVEGG